jgi:hypothetical protein
VGTIAGISTFAFSPDRQGKHPQQHLRHYHAVLQADAFADFANNWVQVSQCKTQHATVEELE